MTIFNNDLIGIIGQTVRSMDGVKLGKVANLHLDDQTGDPEWIEVSTGLLHKPSVVPAVAASRDADSVIVPFGKKQLKAAPAIGDAKFITPVEEALLYTYYKVPFSDAPSDPRLLVPGRPYDPPEPTWARSQAGPGARPFEDWTKEELYERARELDLPGRSKMTKAELVEAISRI